MTITLPNGFHFRRTERCEDCDLRNALDLLGRPLYRNGSMLTYGCAGCGGGGRVPAMRRIDPMWTGRGAK